MAGGPYTVHGLTAEELHGSVFFPLLGELSGMKSMEIK